MNQKQHVRLKIFTLRWILNKVSVWNPNSKQFGLQTLSDIQTQSSVFTTFFKMSLKAKLSGSDFSHFCEMPEIWPQILFFRNIRMPEIWDHKSLDFRWFLISGVWISDIYCTQNKLGLFTLPVRLNNWFIFLSLFLSLVQSLGLLHKTLIFRVFKFSFRLCLTWLQKKLQPR